MRVSESNMLTIVRKTKGKLPRLPFAKLHEEILGSDYELTITFLPPLQIQKLNERYRNKTYIPNVLSFPLSKKEGEIYACLSQIRKDASDHDESYTSFLPFLIMHSMLHLKGHVHGSKMEKEEMRLRKKFNF